MEFEWDEAKRQTVLEQRRLDLRDAAAIFEGRVVTRPDLREDYGEARFISVGVANGRCIVVVHTERDGRTRLISAWFGGRRDYEQYQASIARTNS